MLPQNWLNVANFVGNAHAEIDYVSGSRDEMSN